VIGHVTALLEGRRKEEFVLVCFGAIMFLHFSLDTLVRLSPIIMRIGCVVIEKKETFEKMSRKHSSC